MTTRYEDGVCIAEFGQADPRPTYPVFRCELETPIAVVGMARSLNDKDSISFTCELTIE